VHIVLVVVLLLLILGALPNWQHSNSWGYGPSGAGGLLLVLLIVWLFFGGGLRHF